MKRRQFIQKSLLATSGTWFIPGFLKAFEQTSLNNHLSNDKILIVLQLSGGNDGLNTVIPFRNDLYYEKRPGLSIKPDKLLQITDEIGIHPALKPLAEIYDQGWLTILNGVGYPNPDRSHFRAMDIWQTASSSNQYLQSGWIGRYLDAQCSAADCATAHDAVEIDDTLSLALKGEKIKGLALLNPKKLYQATQTPQLKALQQVANQHPHDDQHSVAYLYKTLAETVSSAGYLYEKSKARESKASYPNTDLGKRLKTIASLILSGVQTQVYYATLAGFDTHVNQAPQQQQLLETYAEAVRAFADDMHQQGQWGRICMLTFSEFGRRVAQNASGGTDHGSANVAFLMGGSLTQAGVYSPVPSLSDLADGDLKYSIDFRNIYATLLQNHLQAPSSSILGGDFETLPLC
ncbi:MAG TPA: twin-arginine translocation pathway signal [Microscillaceae bacterium]|jgi:uncharacterized protein (DUF1501 family)|nr:twin-arginine translocation pathway signal [Microscillaceae bacterium]